MFRMGMTGIILFIDLMAAQAVYCHSASQVSTEDISITEAAGSPGLWRPVGLRCTLAEAPHEVLTPLSAGVFPLPRHAGSPRY
jgi:hypothetical protein